jgi:NAD-dependent deacetylase
MNRSEKLERDLPAAVELLGVARHAIAFTGAGISAESGVPTFRGSGGIWDQYDERHLELGFFKAEPALAWATIRAIFYEFARPFEPNGAHRVLAAWERSGILDFTITQNIDGLHRKAGSERLAEFHGATTQLVCLRCGERALATEAALATLPPRCPCGGVYKPDFVFFGEGIPERAYRDSVAAAERADLCLIVGSTGTVYPAASLPRMVKAHGGSIIEINPEASEFSADIADLVLPLGASEALLALDGLLRAAGAGNGSDV